MSNRYAMQEKKGEASWSSGGNPLIYRCIIGARGEAGWAWRAVAVAAKYPK